MKTPRWNTNQLTTEGRNCRFQAFGECHQRVLRTLHLLHGGGRCRIESVFLLTLLVGCYQCEINVVGSHGFCPFPLHACCHGRIFVGLVYITCIRGRVHGTVHGTFIAMIAQYVMNNSLDDFAAFCHSGGGTYQPDFSLFSVHPDPAGTNPDYDQDCDGPYSRLVIEFELGDRNACDLRQVGHTVLNNDYGTLFVGIKIWKRSLTGVFGAAAVVWEKIIQLEL